MDKTEKILTIAEAAKLLGMSKENARRLAKAGKLKGAFRINERGHWRIRSADLDRLIRSRQSESEAKQG